MGRGRDPNKLTPKEEKLVMLVASGESKIDAYKGAYKSDKMSDNAISVEVNKKFKLPKITLRYEKLIEEHKNKALWTREMSVKALQEAMMICTEDRTMSPFISAIKELNLLEALYPKEDKNNTEEEKRIDAALDRLSDKVNKRFGG